jgi:Ni/Co efflux regulator RcnB
MKLKSLKNLFVAAIACAFLAAPIAGNAQGYGRTQDRDRNYRQDYRGDLKDLTNRAERSSNSFRDYFEHNFRSNGHQERWSGGGHPEHQGRGGQMTLRDAIQNLDEDMERLRSEVDHHGRSRRARDLMDEVMDHMSDVDARIGRTGDWYSYNNDRSWRYDRSDLFNRWRDTRSDINEVNRAFNGRGR